MKYVDESEIFVGDVIWWNEGTSLGLVTKILEDEDKLNDLNLLFPGFFISFNILEKNFEICHVFLEYSDLEDEGIEKCSEELIVQLENCAHKLNFKNSTETYFMFGLEIQKWVILEPRLRVWVLIMILLKSESDSNHVENLYVVDDQFKKYSKINRSQNKIISSSRLPSNLEWFDL